MDKQEWCASRFTSELPDCMPLPELREVSGCEWAKYAISMAKDPGTETLAVAALLPAVAQAGGKGPEWLSKAVFYQI